MKVYLDRSGFTDGTALKTPVIAGLVTRYRSMTKSRVIDPAIAERPSVSLRVDDRKSELFEFYQLYEGFVEVLCDAAQFGITPKAESDYQSARLELVDRYASLRSFVGAYLRGSGEDRRGSADGIRFDAFDALLAPATLDLFLQADDGYTISRITRTREALNLYAQHLMQLLERVK